LLLLALRFARGFRIFAGLRGGLRIVAGFRGGLRSAALEIGRVPAASLQLEAGGAEELGKRGLAALRARRERRVAHLPQEFLLVAAAVATILVDRHFPLRTARNSILTQGLGRIVQCANERPPQAGPARVLLEYQAPTASAADMVQNTGNMLPNAVPRPPNTSGSTVWLALRTTVRTPTASPARPTGAVEYTSAMIVGCVAPRPNPRRNAIDESNGTVRTMGNAMYATNAIANVIVMSVHSFTIRERIGSISRTVKVAAAKLARMSPM